MSLKKLQEVSETKKTPDNTWQEIVMVKTYFLDKEKHQIVVRKKAEYTNHRRPQNDMTTIWPSRRYSLARAPMFLRPKITKALAR